MQDNIINYGASLVLSSEKSVCMQETQRWGFAIWVGKIPWRRTQQPTPEFLPGESLWTEEAGGL